MYHVVVPDDPMVDPEAYRTALDGVATVAVAAVEDTDDLLAATSEADAAVVDVTVPVDERVFETRDLRVVARSSVGVGTVDIDAAAAAGVPVVHAPDYCVDEVATHAVALLLAGVRALPDLDAAIDAGEWPRRPDRPLHRFRDSTLGLVSYGAIARAVRERVRGFDVDVVAHDPYVDDEVLADDGVERVGRAELFERADHVSVHAPDTPETRGLVDADALAALPDHAVVVNVGRGGVVDEDALAAALSAGTVGAAGLDVFEREPLPDDSPLRGRNDVVLTSHAAWYSEEAHDELNRTVATDVRRVLTGEAPANPVAPDRF